MTMSNWIAELDRQLLGNRRELLTDKGRVTHQQAVEKAEREFENFRTREMDSLKVISTTQLGNSRKATAS